MRAFPRAPQPRKGLAETQTQVCPSRVLSGARTEPVSAVYTIVAGGQRYFCARDVEKRTSRRGCTRAGEEGHRGTPGFQPMPERNGTAPWMRPRGGRGMVRSASSLSRCECGPSSPAPASLPPSVRKVMEQGHGEGAAGGREAVTQPPCCSPAGAGGRRLAKPGHFSKTVFKPFQGMWLRKARAQYCHKERPNHLQGKYTYL